jgi:hypothetical protein
MGDDAIDGAGRGKIMPGNETATSRKATRSSGNSPLPLPGLRAWLGAFTAAGMLAAIGFIAKLANEQMLGIQETDWGTLDLSRFAGRCVVDTITTALYVLGKDPPLCILLVLVSLLPAVSMIFLQQYPRLLKVSRFLGIGLAAVGLSIVIVYFEMPTFALGNWLTADIASLAGSAHSGYLGAREDMVQYTYFMSKTNVTDVKTLTDAIQKAAKPNATNEEKKAYDSITDPLSYMAARQFGLFLYNNGITAIGARDNMNLWYSTSLWICAVALLTAFVFVVKGGRNLEDVLLSALYYITAFILLPVACALLPYMYGKLICASEFPSATIQIRPQQLDGNDKHSNDGTLIQSNDGILIGQTDKAYMLLYVVNDATVIHVFVGPDVLGVTIKSDSNHDIVKSVLEAKAYAEKTAYQAADNSGLSSQSGGGNSK